jgi:hypothetical protein
VITDVELPRPGTRPDGVRHELPDLATVEASSPPRPALRSRVRAWTWSHRLSLLLLVGLLVVVGVVHAWGMASSPGPSDDEGTYMAQAWAVQRTGQLAHYTYWYDHPPLGWLTIAGWTWLTGAFDRSVGAVAAGRELMLLVQLAGCALLYLLGRRIGLHRVAAAAAVLLFALSPLGLSYHRMVLLDNLAIPWVLAALVLVSSPTSKLWAYAGGGACFAAALMTKETSLLILPAVVVQLWSRCDRRTRRFCLTAFASSLVLTAAAYPLAALLKGELLPGGDHVSLVEAIRFQLFTRPSSGSVFDATQPAYRTVSGWLDLDPWLLGAGLVALLPSMWFRNLRPMALALGIPAFMVMRDGYLPGPLVIGLLPFAALLVAGLGNALWLRPPRTPRGHPALEARRRAALSLPSTPTAHLPPLRRHLVGLTVRRGAVLVAVALAGVFLAPQWAQGDRGLMAAAPGAPVDQATRWIDRNVSHDSRLLVDDTMWVDLVERGFSRDLGVVWFYKLDFSANLDPSVAERLPDGWLHFDYVVSTPVMQAGLADLPRGLGEVRKALDNSETVATFGSGMNRVEVRRVVKPGLVAAAEMPDGAGASRP